MSNLQKWEEVFISVTKLIPFLNQWRHQQTDVLLLYEIQSQLHQTRTYTLNVNVSNISVTQDINK